MSKKSIQWYRAFFLVALFGLGNVLLTTMPSKHWLPALPALASPHIINGKTPDDLDDPPCPENDLIEYVEKAKKVISSKWQPIKGFEDRSAVAIFTVTKQGVIEEPKIVEGSGSQAVDTGALDALKASSPLPPLPKGAPDSIQIRYVFSWHVTHNYNR